MTYDRELLVVVLGGLIGKSAQSIAGVTYRDHFDFEQRYRNIYECDPFYWYPLHLPEHCMKLFEKLIRNGVASTFPVQVVKNVHSLFSNSHIVYFEGSPSVELTPYEKLFHMLRNDVNKEPSAPQITLLPGLGAVALYKQPVSRRSGKYIKKIAELYRDANADYNRYFTTESINPDEEKAYKKENINTKVTKKKTKNGKVITIYKSTN